MSLRVKQEVERGKTQTTEMQTYIRKLIKVKVKTGAHNRSKEAEGGAAGKWSPRQPFCEGVMHPGSSALAEAPVHIVF